MQFIIFKNVGHLIFNLFVGHFFFLKVELNFNDICIIDNLFMYFFYYNMVIYKLSF